LGIWAWVKLFNKNLKNLIENDVSFDFIYAEVNNGDTIYDSIIHIGDFAYDMYENGGK